MQMAQQAGTDVTTICTQAEKQYLGCREKNGKEKLCNVFKLNQLY
jgi:hypothetical protein